MIKYINGIKGAVDLRDCVAAIGLSLVAIGIGVLFWPAALIVVGGALIYLSLGGVTHGNPR